MSITGILCLWKSSWLQICFHLIFALYFYLQEKKFIYLSNPKFKYWARRGQTNNFFKGVIRQNMTWSHTKPLRTTLTHGGQVNAVRHRLVVLLHCDRFLESLHLDDLLTLVELGPGILVIWSHFYNLTLKTWGFILFSSQSHLV